MHVFLCLGSIGARGSHKASIMLLDKTKLWLTVPSAAFAVQSPHSNVPWSTAFKAAAFGLWAHLEQKSPDAVSEVEIIWEVEG